MSREIKFRALLETNKGLHQWCTYGIGTKPHLFGGYKWITEDLQFIGLKDKNYKEVYEDDIVLLPDDYKDRILDDGSGPIEPFNHLSKVVFTNGSFGLQVSESGECFKEGFWSFERIKYESGDSIEKLEVIGNAYENPELLEN